MILAGGAAPFLPAIHRYYHKPMESEFLVPSTQRFEIAAPGSHSLWYNYLTTFNGVNYSSSSNFPTELTITLRQVETGTTIPMTTNNQAFYYTTTSASRTIGSFDLPSPGHYDLSVSGKGVQPVVCSFSRDWVLNFVGATFLLLFGGVISAGLGLLLIVLVFVWRRSG